MSLVMVGYLAVIVLLVLLGLGVPIAWAMAAVGIVGELYVTGFTQTASQVSLILWENGTLFVFTALPLFLLMGQLAFRTGITDDLYDCVHKWFGRLPGGLAVAAVLSNAAYGAVTGNSVASVATMGPMVMPQFRKYKYDLSLATGTLASAGTLAVLVPPSAVMVIYGVWTETSIGDLFLAGIIPCVILAVSYCLVLMIWCHLRPELGPKGPAYTWGERFRSLSKLLPALIIIFIVLGGIYGGVMAPSEAGGVGVAGVLIISIVMRRFTFKALKEALHETILTSGMVFCIVITGILFSRFLVHTQVTSDLVKVSRRWNWAAYPAAGAARAVFHSRHRARYLRHADSQPAVRDAGNHPCRHRQGLVRRVRGGDGRAGGGQSAGGHHGGGNAQCRAGCVYERDLPRLLSLPGPDHPAYLAADRFSRAGAVAAQPQQEMNP